MLAPNVLLKLENAPAGALVCDEAQRVDVLHNVRVFHVYVIGGGTPDAENVDFVTELEFVNLVLRIGF